MRLSKRFRDGSEEFSVYTVERVDELPERGDEVQRAERSYGLRNNPTASRSFVVEPGEVIEVDAEGLRFKVRHGAVSESVASEASDPDADVKSAVEALSEDERRSLALSLGYQSAGPITRWLNGNKDLDAEKLEMIRRHLMQEA